MWSGYSEKGTGSQERGPGTFTFTPPGGAPSAEAGPQGQAVQMQGGVRGQASPGNTAQAIRIPSSNEDRTLQALMKFGQDQIAPHLERAREEAFVRGVQKAASGQAMQEIVNEQPWYTKLFGDGPVVEGARMYSIQAKTEAWAAAHENNMGALKTQSPDAVPGYLMESMKQYLTGDDATDGMIKGNMVKAVPQLIKRHTKEYFKYQQEQASEQRVNAIVAAGQSVQLAHQADPGMYTPEDLDARKLSFLSTMTPTEGSDPDAYERDIKSVIQIYSESGDFHALRTMRDAGVIGHMKAEDRIQVEAGINRYGAYHAANAAVGYVERMAKIKMDAHEGRISAAEVGPLYDSINAEYSSKTGNDAPIINKQGYMSDMMASMKARVSAEEEANRVLAYNAAQRAKAIKEGTDEAALGAQILHAAGQGDLPVLKAQGIKTVDIDNTVYQFYKQDPVKAMPALALNAMGGYGNPYIKAEVQAVVSSGQGDNINDGFIKGYGLWKAMRNIPNGGLSATSEYFPELASRRYEAFEMALGSQPIEKFGELAYQRSMQTRLKPGYSFTKDESAAVEKLISKEYSSSFRLVNGVGLTPEAARVAQAAIAAPYGSLKETGNPQTALKESLELAKASGLEIVGSHAFVSGRDKPRLKSYIAAKDPALTEGQIGEGLDDLVKEYTVKATGRSSADSYTLIRAGDRDGKAQFQLYLAADGVTQPPVSFSSDDIATQIKAKYEREVAAPARAKADNLAKRNTSRDKSIYRDVTSQLEDRLRGLQDDRARYVKSNSDTRTIDEAIANTEARIARTKQ